MSKPVMFFVAGLPAPGGSKRGFLHPHTKRVVVVEDSRRNRDWRASVALAAQEHFSAPFEGPLFLSLHFVFPRPKGHYGSGRNAGRLRDAAPFAHTTKPDLTKLVRSTEDALKAIAWLDDSQVTEQSATKTYGSRPGCMVTILPAEKPGASQTTALSLATAGAVQ